MPSTDWARHRSAIEDAREAPLAVQRELLAKVLQQAPTSEPHYYAELLAHLADVLWKGSGGLCRTLEILLDDHFENLARQAQQASDTREAAA